MDYNNNYEQEIDLKDLLFAVLHKWKPILLVAIILAVLLGGYKGYSTYQSLHDSKKIEDAAEKYQTELDTYEEKVEVLNRELENLQTDLAEQEEYLEKSVKINMNVYEVAEVKTELFVKTDYLIMPGMEYQTPNFTDTILRTYKSVLDSTEFLNSVAENAGMEVRFLKELITTSTGGNIITIQVRHETLDQANAILDDILGGIESAGAKIRATIGDHTVTTVMESAGTLVDLGLGDTQKAENDKIRTMNESIKAKQEEIDALNEPTLAEISDMDAIKSGIKFAILGGVLGAFMVAFVVCVVFLMNGKVYSANELRNRFRVMILGVVPTGKKYFIVDAWLNRLEGRNMGSAEQEYVLIAANIKNNANNAKKILVTGTAKNATIRQAAEKLAKELDGLEVIAGGNLLSDAETLRTLPEADAVVLVEQCNVSSYGKIELTLERAAALQKNVIGCVVFE